MKKFLTVFTTLVFYVLKVSAQVNITSGLTADELATYITGGGVKVLNVTYSCPDFSQGRFKVIESNLGLDSGIIITNGRAATALGGPYYYPEGYCWGPSFPHLIPDSLGVNGPSIEYSSWGYLCGTLGPSTMIGTLFDPIGDYDVDTLMVNSVMPEYQTADACKLEFDFIAARDSVFFNYVYGSMNYNSNPCGPADPFACFLSGPSISGKKNIATVPGTDFPICVATIHDTAVISANLSFSCFDFSGYPQFSEYYVDNYMGETITYGGFSTVLTAKAAVTPCDTYHIKMVIADTEVGKGDSGVFIKAGSFSAPGSQLTAAGTAGLHTTGPGPDTAIAVAGCAPALFTFHTPTPQPTPTTYYVSYTGSAVPGTDYAPLPNSFVMPPGDTLFSWPVTVLQGGAFSTTLVATVSDSTAAFCFGGAPELRTAAMILIDSLPLAIATSDTALCLPGCLSSVTNSFSADSQLAFFWTPAAGVADPFAKNTLICPPVSDTAITYTLHTFLPGGGCDTSRATITLLPVSRPVVTASVPSGAATTCLEAPLPLLATAAPDYQDYAYLWQPAAYLDSSTSDHPSFLANGVPGTYSLYVTATPQTPYGAVAACAATDTLTITVLPIGLEFYTKDTAICLGDSVVVKADGSPQLSFAWTPAAASISDPAIANPVITPDTPGYVTYTLTASYSNCPDIVKSFTLETDPFPIDVRIPADTLVCRQDELRINSAVTAGAFPYQYTWSGERPNGTAYPLGVDTAINFKAVQDTWLWLTVNTPAGCWGADTMQVKVQDCCHLNVATAFTPNGDGRNDVLGIVAQSGANVAFFRVYNRKGNLVYEQKGNQGGWDGTYKGEPQDVGVYMYVIKYRCAGEQEDKIHKGDVTLLR